MEAVVTMPGFLPSATTFKLQEQRPETMELFQENRLGYYGFVSFFVRSVCDSLMGKSVCTPFFTLEIEHGGIFLGAVSELEYYNSSVEVLDYLDNGNFSYALLEEHLNWLGYPKNQHIIYWCLPDKKICDGLVRITGDEDLQQVIRASANHKVLVIMVDHSDFIINFRQDLILKEPSFESPVRVANCSVDASNSGTIICFNVDNPISEVAEASAEAENLLNDATNLLDVVHTHVLTEAGAEPNLLLKLAE
ncbi:hypothetical protein D1007_41695 [Hordeum vulgare]|nr:hypothetical protein D1007_41695 [Hordeum vulgare]